MKYLILTVMLSVVGCCGSASAEPYISLYGSANHNSDPVVYETNWDSPNVIATFGIRSTGQVGGLAELGFQQVGMVALAGGYLDIGKFKFSGGAIGIDDKSKTYVAGWSDDTSTEFGTGGFAGIQYKNISLRYVRYQATHNYTVNRGKGKHREVMSLGPQDVKREMVWFGVTFPF